jgi:hypothetical protein
MTQETNKEWDELTYKETEWVLASHASPLGLSWTNERHMRTMRRIFCLGRPRVIIGYDDNGGPLYCRIHADSVDMMRLLIRQYL